MKFSNTKFVFSNQTFWGIGILLISLLLRWTLVLRGGQYYFSDEHRYEISRASAGFLLQGKLGEAFSHLFVSPEHIGFKIIGLFPALLEHLVKPSLAIPAMFFSLFSALNLYLIFLLAQRMGADSTESLLALGIAASSQSLLYYSRHLMPYDLAMSFGLLSLFVAVKEKPTPKTSLLCGALGFFCFITYNGYWLLAGFAILSHLLVAEKRMIVLLRRGIWLALGFVIPLVLIVLGAKLSGVNFLAEYVKFARTVNQGDFAEGWSLPFEYFWHAEHLLIIMVGLLSLFAAISILRNRDEKNVTLWAVAVIFIYVGLWIPSVYLHSFVVYGRLARQIMPFLILLAAHGLYTLSLRKPSIPYVVQIVMSLIVIQGLWNYGYSFRVSFPIEFSTQAQVEYPDFGFSAKRMSFGAPALCQNAGYVMENAKYFLNPPEPHPEIQGNVLLSHSHPVNFLPYQYEGYTPEQRQEFRHLKLEMRLYKVDSEFASDNNPTWTTMKNCVVKE